MNKIEPTNNNETVCNLQYLSGLMDGKIHLIKEIMDSFLVQAKEELASINNAILKKDYATIKNFAHTMKSTFSIVGVSILLPVLQEMEDLGTDTTYSDLSADKAGSYRDERLTALNLKLNAICKKAFEEIENYSFSS